jgi:GDPmannose 4,6-dehydratase
MATALVTGVTGQLGFFVAEQLAQRGHTVFGLVRQSTLGRRGAADERLPYKPVTGDLLDEYSLLSILEEVQPDLLFNFGAQSFIPSSWTQPILTAQYTGLGIVRLLEAVRRASPRCRVLQAGSSELFAGAERSPQDEDIPIRPLNPYGIAKAFAYHTIRAYRQHYGLFATNAIFFTNESLRRSPEFLFRKVTQSVAQIVAGRRETLSLGNLQTIRDWGYAPEYAEISVALLDLAEAGDYVVATGVGHTVRDLVAKAFELVDLDWQKYVRVDTNLVRPSEPAPLIGNTARLRQALGRAPRVTFDGVLRILLAHDLKQLGCEIPFAEPTAELASGRG